MFPILFTGLTNDHNEIFVEKTLNNKLPPNRQFRGRIKIMENLRIKNEQLATILLPLDDAIYACDEIKTICSDGRTFNIVPTTKLREAAGSKLKAPRESQQSNNNHCKTEVNKMKSSMTSSSSSSLTTSLPVQQQQQKERAIENSSKRSSVSLAVVASIKKNDIVNIVYIEDDVETPRYFYVTPKSQLGNFEFIHELIASVNLERKSKMNNDLTVIDRGDIVLALSIEHNSWYRAKAISSTKQNNKFCTFFYLDFGNFERLPIENVYLIPEFAKRLIDFPPCALRCTFQGRKDSIADFILLMSDMKDDLLTIDWTVEKVEKNKDDDFVVVLFNQATDILLPTDIKMENEGNNSTNSTNNNNGNMEERVRNLEKRMKQIENLLN